MDCCCGIPSLNPRCTAKTRSSLALILSICTSFHYVIIFFLCFFFFSLGKTAVCRERETQYQMTIGLLRKRCRYPLLIFPLVFTPLGSQDLPRGWWKLSESSGRVEQRCMEEPPQQGGPVQQFFREQPARVSHSAQLSPGKPMALSSNSCKLPGFSSFLVLLLLLFEKIICIPLHVPQSSWGLSCFFCLLITAEDVCCQPTPPQELCTALSEG